MKNIFPFIFLLFCAYLKAESISEMPLRHHIIIALDKAGCDGWIGDDEVIQGVNNLLRGDLSHLVNPDSGELSRSSRKLYEDGDYLSVVGFRINATQGDLKVFAMPMNNGDSKMAYCEYTQEQLINLIDVGWRHIALQPYNPGKEPYSLVSVAKAYALAALKSREQHVNRTFLILISDKHYNGNDFYNEMQAFYQKHQGVTLTPQKIFSKCYEVEKNYVIKYINTQNVWAGNTNSPKGYIEFYEYVPLQQNFTLSTVINFPTHLVAKLKRDGSYTIELPLSWQGGDSYRLHHLEAFPIETEKKVFKTPNNAVYLDSLTESTLRFNVPSNQSAKSIQIRAWLNLMDGFYNATLMSPQEDSPLELGRDGLNYLLSIDYEKTETVMGIPVSYLFWPPFVEDQYKVALIWRILFCLLFLGGLLAFIRWLRKPRYYTPHNINWPNASSKIQKTASNIVSL